MRTNLARGRGGVRSLFNTPCSGKGEVRRVKCTLGDCFVCPASNLLRRSSFAGSTTKG